MQTQRHTITIHAPKEKVWHTMLDADTFRQWTSVFNPTPDGESYYEGSWEKGSEIRFIGPDPETGKPSGMYARIADNRPYEFVSIQHLGMIMNGVLDTTSDEVKKWAPAFENYTFLERNGATEVVVEVDTNEEFSAMFQETWPQALQKLKELAER